MKKNITGTIKSNEKIAKDTYKLEILSELDNAFCGQFISILCENKTMRRPFSISDFEKLPDSGYSNSKNNSISENNSICKNSSTKSLTTVLYKLKGEGTNYIKNLKKEDKIDFLAPLGNGFNILNKKSLLIGAGIGIAPMLFLKKELDKQKIENFLISGFKQDDEAIKGSDKTVIGGSVMDNIEDIIKEKKIEQIYSCAPMVVLKMVDETAQKYNIPCELALEKVMACSIGVCRGCVIKLIKNNKIENYSVCKDGPVFQGGEIIWE